MITDDTPEAADLVADAVRALATAGWLTLDGLAAELGLEHESLDFDDLMDELIDLDRVVLLRDEGIGDKVGLLAGVTITRRLTAGEAAGGYLALDGELAPIYELLGGSIPLSHGGRAEVSLALSDEGIPSARLVGPPGWLDGVAEGALVGLEIADGLLAVEPDVEPRDDDGPVKAFAEGAARALELRSYDDDPRLELAAALWEGLAHDRDALCGVLPPLSELADAADLNRKHGRFAAPDSAWGEGPANLGAMLIAMQAYDLEPESAADLQGLREARAAALRGALVEEQLASAADGFADEDALAAFCHERLPDAAAASVARAVAEAHHDGWSQAGALFLLARHAEVQGDTAQAERLLLGALESDPEHPLALADMAWFASDRGDAARALALLGRAGLEGDAEASMLREFTSHSAGDVGRNEPCPCGSGRKFKRCCGGRAGGPLPRRADWLAHKVAWFVRRPPQWERVKPIGRARLPEQEPGWRYDAEVDPVVVDLAVFDLGLLEEFLDQRGPLLPDDERALAESWRDTRRTVFRLDAQRGERLSLTDVVTGEQVVASGVGAPGLERGEHLLGRLVRSGGDERMLFWAPLRIGRVAPRHLESLCAPGDPVATAGYLAAGRMRLNTTEGEPLVLCDIRYALPAGMGRPAARGALDGVEALVRRSGDDDLFDEPVDVDGQTKLRGTVTIRGREVHIDTNADARADRLKAMVEGAIPGLEPLLERRTSAWQAIEDQRRYGIPVEPHEPSADERVMLAEFLREQEERWIDQPVPAFGGLTPRQAVDDPEQRPALDHLLANPVGAFDHDRLRRLLGLGEDVEEAGETMDNDPWGDDPSHAERRRFAVPPAQGQVDGIDLALLDPSDEDHRRLLIEAEHPELRAALADDVDEIEGPDGEPMSPRLHIAMHEIVANQLWDGEPAAVWDTAQRLLADGYERHEILHMLSSCIAEEMWSLQREQRMFDLARFSRKLDALPGSWEAQRPEGPAGAQRPEGPAGAQRPEGPAGAQRPEGPASGPRRTRRSPPGAGHPPR